MMKSIIAASLICAASLLSEAPASAAGEAPRAVALLTQKIYPILAEQEGDLCFSPLSIATAFAMLYAGAEGETAREMSDALGFTPQVHASFAQLHRDAEEVPADAGELSSACSLWPKRGYILREKYKDILRTSYGAEVIPLDYEGDLEAARGTINDWISRNTRGKIEEMLPKGSVSGSMTMMLVDAVWFKASWLDRFSSDETSIEPFASPNGMVPAAMMKRRGMMQHLTRPGFCAVKLPYQRGAFSMTVILPDEGVELGDVERAIFGDGIDASLPQNEWSRLEVDLWLPKFKASSSIDIKEAMTRVGIVKAFEPGAADFSGMNGRRDLYVNSASHKAVIETDESGTEAAASTAIGMMVTSLMDRPEPVEFHVDRPFLYIVRSEIDGTMLFVGRMTSAKI